MAPNNDLQQLYAAAFVAGFKASGEGFNGECMVGHAGRPEDCEHFVELLNNALSNDEKLQQMLGGMANGDVV